MSAMRKRPSRRRFVKTIVSVAAGALNAGASVDIAPNGALSGRIVADVKTASQTMRATLGLGGTLKEPQVRNQ